MMDFAKDVLAHWVLDPWMLEEVVIGDEQMLLQVDTQQEVHSFVRTPTDDRFHTVCE